MKKILSTTRKPDITFHATGEIYITARVSRILDLSADSCINVAIEKGEYLLFAENYRDMIGNHTGRCHPVNAGSRYFRANSVRLSRAILQATRTSQRVALMCGEPLSVNGKTYLPIITGMTL
ncbi:MAG: hypothetical protein K2M69_03405 [Muribaculaceae bacterium]|nr:hypothetical protein [Muribaculaceae bacterium]